MRCVAEMSVEAPFEGTAREQLLHDISSSDSDDEELSITTNEHEGVCSTFLIDGKGSRDSSPFSRARTGTTKASVSPRRPKVLIK